MSIGIDFDFARYIAMRRGAVEQQARDGAAYAYLGERKFRRTLSAARPVTMALEATTRLWRDVARAELLGTSVKVTDQQYPRVHEAARRAGEALGVRVPPVFVAPGSASAISGARVLGTEDAPYVVVGADWADRLDDDELVSIIGHELGHLQNGHVLYATALYYLTHSAVFFVRWIVQPAIMTLQAWSRRAEISCDRAALLATRDLDKTLHAMVKVGLGLEKGSAFRLDEYLRDLPDTKKGLGRYAELFRNAPYLPKRIQAVRWFAEGAFYTAVLDQDATGKPTAADIDKKIADLISVF
jgi:Zn-dependent protease with chaperone function